MAGRLKRKKTKPRIVATCADGRRKPGPKVDLEPGSDTALKLLEDIHAHRLDARDLSVGQRRACLLLCANGSQTSAELAQVFRVTPTTIRKDLQRIREQVGREVTEWSMPEVLGQVVMSAERCTAMAMKSKDPGLAWTIQRDLAKLLKEFGVVGESDKRSGFKLTLESIGEGYERARGVLSQQLDPVLTGAQPVKEIKQLPLDVRLTGARPPGPVEPMADPMDAEGS